MGVVRGYSKGHRAGDIFGRQRAAGHARAPHRSSTPESVSGHALARVRESSGNRHEAHYQRIGRLDRARLCQPRKWYAAVDALNGTICIRGGGFGGDRFLGDAMCYTFPMELTHDNQRSLRDVAEPIYREATSVGFVITLGTGWDVLEEDNSKRVTSYVWLHLDFTDERHWHTRFELPEFLDNPAQWFRTDADKLRFNI